MELIKRLLREWFTGKGNESFELMRALLFASVAVILFCILYHMVINKQFDPISASGGLGALLFGGGAGARLKDGASLTNPAPSASVGTAENVTVQN